LQQRHQRQHQHVSGEPGALHVIAQAHADLSLSDAGDVKELTDEGLDSLALGYLEVHCFRPSPFFSGMRRTF
jgi:hypothetical protein